MALKAHSKVGAASTNATATASTNTTATASTNTTKTTLNSVGGLSHPDVIVSKEPYEITSCAQVLEVEVQTLADQNDYTTRKPAFVTMSAYLINLFESKDNNKLLESISLANLDVVPHILKGSVSCMVAVDDKSLRNITICLKNKEEEVEFAKAFSNFESCRMGSDLQEFDPITINGILMASCNGFTETTGKKYDMPKIKSEFKDDMTKSGVSIL